MQVNDKVQVSILLPRAKAEELTRLLSRDPVELTVEVTSFDDVPVGKLIFLTDKDDWSVPK